MKQIIVSADQLLAVLFLTAYLVSLLSVKALHNLEYIWIYSMGISTELKAAVEEEEVLTGRSSPELFHLPPLTSIDMSFLLSLKLFP